MSLTKNNAKYINSLFKLAENHQINNERINIDKTFSKTIKEITKYFGANECGIAKIRDDSYYAFQGGLSDKINLDTYGKKVVKHYQTAIVYTVEMDKDLINRAPHYEEFLATEKAYVKVAEIGSKLVMYLKDLGYKAMFNNSEFYLAPLVPLAYDAGLGEIGMVNHIITPKYGNRVRLGAVFTTLIIDYDKPIDFGLRNFCKKCALCLQNCPTHAIKHQPRIVNNRPFYKFDDNACFSMWLKIGTDCGICISSCPFSQGIDLDSINHIKDNHGVISEILDKHYQKHGRRAYNKEKSKILGDNYE